jgi:uncharacterized repeat protein (TIGR03809 family)
MNEQTSQAKNAELARKWRALTERRREYFAELYNSGRWRRYYKEDEFLQQMRETAKLAEAWDKLGDVPQESTLDVALRALERAERF